jgi:hypothetical protein
MTGGKLASSRVRLLRSIKAKALHCAGLCRSVDDPSAVWYFCRSPDCWQQGHPHAADTRQGFIDQRAQSPLDVRRIAHPVSSVRTGGRASDRHNRCGVSRAEPLRHGAGDSRTGISPCGNPIRSFVTWQSQLRRRAPLSEPNRKARARVDQWIDWQASELNRSWSYAFMSLVRQSPDYQDKTALDERHRAVVERPWPSSTGNWKRPAPTSAARQFSLADIPIGLSVNRWFETPLAHPDYAAVKAYYERLSLRPGLRAARQKRHSLKELRPPLRHVPPASAQTCSNCVKPCPGAIPARSSKSENPAPTARH